MIGVCEAWAHRITPSRWFCADCADWRSLWCVLDALAHKLGCSDHWICRKHDAALERHLLKRFSGSPNPLF